MLTLPQVWKFWRRRFFDTAFPRKVSPHSQNCELGANKNATSVSRSNAGGGELAYEKTSGNFAFELLQRTLGPVSANLRVGVFGVIAVDH